MAEHQHMWVERPASAVWYEYCAVCGVRRTMPPSGPYRAFHVLLVHFVHGSPVYTREIFSAVVVAENERDAPCVALGLPPGSMLAPLSKSYEWCVEELSECGPRGST